MDKRLREIESRLDDMTIYEVRQVAREVRAHSGSGQKGTLIKSILRLAKGEDDPKPISSRGAPPKSVKFDEALVAEIRAVRRDILLGDGREVMTVEDRSGEREVCGLLGNTDGAYNLITFEGELPVASAYITRYSLRVGDKIAGKAKALEGGSKALVSIDTINGVQPLSLKNRKNFSDLAPVYPDRRIILSQGAGGAENAVIDMFAPLAFGQRVLISSPAYGGKTTLIKKIASSLTEIYPQTKLIILLLCGKPEEIADFKRTFRGAEILSTDFAQSGQDGAELAQVGFEYAKRVAELGGDAVVLAEGLFEACGADGAKKLLRCAINAETGASLTVFATLPETCENYDGIVATASSVIKLSGELASKRVFPAIDAKSSYSGREEQLLTEKELKLTADMRREYSPEEIIKIIQSNEAGRISEKNKNG